MYFTRILLVSICSSTGGIKIEIYVATQPAEIFYQVHDLLRLAFPDYTLHRVEKPGDDNIILAEVMVNGDCVSYQTVITLDGKTNRESGSCNISPLEPDYSSCLRRTIRRFVYTALCGQLGKELSPYGTLTGVRPVKIVHRLLDQGYSKSEVLEYLEKEYWLSHSKALLLWEVAAANRPFLALQKQSQRFLSVYIGIPFCPSRCCYCSFPGSSIRDYADDIDPFMTALLVEMEAVGDFIVRRGWRVETIYLGGGTPTVLNESHLNAIFKVLQYKYISADTREITVEAGRPDTLSPAKLDILKQLGVTRLCINPQSMDDDTLRRIGRHHTAGMVCTAVEWARSSGIEHINMDLIVGLPGEGRGHLKNTAQQILQMEPDNITVHILASKRGSSMAQVESRAQNAGRSQEVAMGMAYLDQVLRDHQYLPYYLYRQKYMQSNLENIGYQRDANPCIYNIQMIEERQTIIGLGGGASSKFVNTSDWSLTSLLNPKEPRRYAEVVEKLVARKVDKLQALI